MVTRALRWLACLVLLVAASPALAQEIRLELDVDQLAQGQRTGFDVVVQGARPRGLPQIRSDAGLTTDFVGQSRTTSIVNGRMTQYTRFRFEVVGHQQGQWRLGPAFVDVDEGGGRSRTLRSEPVTVVVGPRADGTVADGWIEIDNDFDVDEAWQGQVVVYHTALRTRRELASAGWFGQPDDGLLVPKDARPEQREYVVQDGRGSVLVQETWQPFVVTSAGELTWSPPALEVNVIEPGSFGLFRRTAREVVTGDPLRLSVRPLPPAPPGFSGLVGDFELQARLEGTRVKVGESLDWTLLLDGTGSLEGFQLPPVPEVDGLRVYDGGVRPRASVRRGAWRAGMTFERTLVPTREGRVELPPVELVVFSPTRGDYVTVRSHGVSLDVLPGEHVDLERRAFGPEGAVLAEGVAPVAPGGVRPLRTGGAAVRLPWLAWMPLALALPAALTLGIGGVSLGGWASRRWRARAEARVRPATPLERLRHLPEAPEARLAALDEALRLALAQVAGVPVARLDRRAALAVLPGELAGEAADLTGLLDRVRFAGASTPDDLEPRVRALVAALEREAA